MSDQKTITTLLNDMAADFCDNYCKYPEQYDEDHEEELYKHCETCPINILGV